MHGRGQEWLDAGKFFGWIPDNTSPDRNELQIFHAEFGDPDAPVALLLHGFPTSSIDWYVVAPLLAASRRVCVVDFPGFGFSDKPKGENCTVAATASGRVLRAGDLGVAAGAVVAHDRGDSVALVSLLAAPRTGRGSELTHLVLSNGNVFLPLSTLTNLQTLCSTPIPRQLCSRCSHPTHWQPAWEQRRSRHRVRSTIRP